MKNKKKITTIVVVVVVVVVVLCLIFCGKKSKEISYDTAEVTEATISNSVTATGTIEPVTSVDVGTQVSGTVAKLYVDYNSIVKKGQLIAELDKTNLISELNIAKASL
ncbi:MAG: biotin/lipoyl-binding protein, partial [Prevotella sp.]|nr:biotin/lipoyl-binding protein [Prevotella sp.]